MRNAGYVLLRLPLLSLVSNGGANSNGTRLPVPEDRLDETVAEIVLCKSVTMMKKGANVLDVCCGRGLLLPLMRYYASDVAKYVGVDIHEANINEQKRAYVCSKTIIVMAAEPATV